MKRLVFFLVAALVISGMAWGQTVPGNPTIAGTSALNTAGNGGLFDRWNVVPTLSTEARYSGWIFSTIVDDYIDVNWYNPKIGTFVLLGGFPAYDGGAGVDDTDYLNNYALSIGFAKTFKKFYMGVYYGGSLVNVRGDLTDPSTGPANSPANKATADHSANWRNDLALLIGLSEYGLGAFRLDFSLNTQTRERDYDDNVWGKTRTDAPRVALTWGGLQLGGLDPYITIGYKFADQNIWGQYNASNKYESVERTSNSEFGIQLGLNYDFDSNRSVWADLAFVNIFGTEYSGDTNAHAASGAPALKPGFSGNSFTSTYGGLWGFGFKAAYKQIMEFGKVSFGFNPNVALAFVRDNTRDISGDSKTEADSRDNFEMATGLNLGIKFQANQKFAFYTGAGLTFFDWRTNSNVGAAAKNGNHRWSVTGISWDGGQWAGMTGVGDILGFGMTITPIKNLVIGTGLNAVLDRFFTINLRDMRIDSGANFNNTTGQNNLGSWAMSLFENFWFDLTVSYSF